MLLDGNRRRRRRRWQDAYLPPLPASVARFCGSAHRACHKAPTLIESGRRRPLGIGIEFRIVAYDDPTATPQARRVPIPRIEYRGEDREITRNARLGPTWSNDDASGSTPSVLTRPNVGFKPAISATSGRYPYASASVRSEGPIGQAGGQRGARTAARPSDGAIGRPTDERPQPYALRMRPDQSQLHRPQRRPRAATAGLQPASRAGR